MLLNQLITSQKIEKPSKYSSDKLSNQIIKAIGPSKQLSSQATTQESSTFFDMFQEHPPKNSINNAAAERLMSKIMNSSTKKQGSHRKPREISHKEEDHSRVTPEKERVEKPIKIEKKPQKIQGMPVISDEYLQEMCKISDMGSMMKLKDGEIAKLANRCVSIVPKKADSLEKAKEKVEKFQKQEKLILQKLMPKNKEIEPVADKLKKIEKIMPPQANKQQINKKKETNNPKNNIENQGKNHEKHTENNAIQAFNNKHNTMNKNSYDPLMANTGKNNKNSEISNKNIQSNNKAGTKNTQIKGNSQYNPLEFNSKNANMKRKREEIYSNSEEMEEEQDSFIDDGEYDDLNIDYRSELRKITNYNPHKFRDLDYDDDAMEVGFNEIEKEEKRARMIAKQEDEKEWKYIQKEKLKEEMKKKRKLS